jgi:hypothetical protein
MLGDAPPSSFMLSPSLAARPSMELEESFELVPS